MPLCTLNIATPTTILNFRKEKFRDQKSNHEIYKDCATKIWSYTVLMKTQGKVSFMRYPIPVCCKEKVRKDMRNGIAACLWIPTHCRLDWSKGEVHWAISQEEESLGSHAYPSAPKHIQPGLLSTAESSLAPSHKEAMSQPILPLFPLLIIQFYVILH